MDITTRLRQTRADMIGTDDEQHYWDCHDAATEIERLRVENADLRAAIRIAITAQPVPAEASGLINPSRDPQAPAQLIRETHQI